MLIKSHKDGDWELVNWNPETGVQTWVKNEVLPNGIIEQTFRYDTPVNEANLAVNHEQSMLAGKGWKGDYHHVASLPGGWGFHGYIGEAIQADDNKAIAKWLNDPDNRAFRTKEGTI
jgi:hypothetical protein